VQIKSVLAAHEVDRILDGEVFDHSSLTIECSYGSD
jgi:hypothetical protein